LITPADHWGPWRPSISYPERVARFRELRAIAGVYVSRGHPLIAALWLAESGDPAEVEQALIELNRLPALQRRRVEASYADHARFEVKGKKKKQLEGAG
jgi:hypothetical protein